MNIVEAIVHRVDKDRQHYGVVTLRRQALPVDKVLQNTVEKIRQTYNGNPARGFGVFQADKLLYPFSKELNDYCDGIKSLYDFTSTAMNVLLKEINMEPLATGGYVLFVKYDEGGKSFFMVAILKLKGGTGIDEKSLALSANWNLDVDHLHEAARINIDNWAASQGRYISFARKGAGNRKFTDYFRNFVGCDEFIESAAQTNEIIRVIKDYCVDKNLSPVEARKIKARAYEYFVEQSKDKKPINLEAISMRFDGENPKAFLDYLAEKDIELSDGFEPDRNAYRQLKRIGGKDLDLTINFDRSLLGDRVKYDPEKQQLLITKLPPSLIAELEEENGE
jgi:nucleoid-associated protein